jgi:hypothetical protein
LLHRQVGWLLTLENSHTTTLAPPPKRGFFSRNNTTGDWFLNFFRERFTDVLT